MTSHPDAKFAAAPLQINISEVARKAGVSTATVSRVLGGSSRVAAPTRDRVLQVIKETGYRPSGIARSLRLKATSVIGLVVTDIQNPFYPEIVRGVEDTAMKMGRSTLLCNASDDPEREKAYIDVLLQQRVDGIIVISSGLVRRHSELLASLNIPVMIVNHEDEGLGLPAISSPEEHMGALAAQHLIECGYAPLVYAGGLAEGLGRLPRFEGFIREAAGQEVHYFPGDGSLESGLNTGRKIGASIKGRVGIAAHNDLMAIGLLRSLLEQGINVPQDAGVMGCDDIIFSSAVTPSLTTVRQDQYEMGCRAMNSMHDLLKGNPVPKHQLIPVSLIHRESTGLAEINLTTEGLATK